MHRRVWVALAVAVVAVASVAGKYLPGGLSSVMGLLRTNMIVQSMFGTSIATAVMALASRCAGWVVDWGLGSLSTTFRVPGPNPPTSSVPGSLHDMVLRFMTKTPAMQMPVATAFFKEEKTMTAAQRFAVLSRGLDVKGTDTDDVVGPHLVSYSVKPALLPITAQFQGSTIVMTIGPDNMDVTLRTAGRGRHTLIQAFLQHIVDADTQSHAKHSAVATSFASVSPMLYKGVVALEGACSWEQVRAMRTRGQDTLHLPQGVLDMLIKDAFRFFTSGRDYQKDQRPYRRGWCVDGPPGTGKSTLPGCVGTALSEKCGVSVPVCVLPLAHPHLTDMALDTLMNKAPVPGIIVLEDVDAALRVTGARDGKKDDDGDRVNKVTLAGLLNALDGVGAHEGHLVIMTTNYKNKLDPALLRPGRCDVQVHLPLATRHQIQCMFRAAFPAAKDDDEARFLALVRANKYSPATLAEFLMRVRGDMETALDSRKLPSQDKVTWMKDIMGAYSIAPKAALFRELWWQGLEDLFPAALMDARESWRVSDFSHYFLRKMDVEEAIRSSPEHPCMKEWATGTMAEDMFLAVFDGHPDALELVAEFVRVVQTWCGDHPERKFCRGRLARHLMLNSDCPRKAIASAGDWLLTYNRTGANLLNDWQRMDFGFYFFGWQRADIDACGDEAQAKLQTLGIQSSWDMVRVMNDAMDAKHCECYRLVYKDAGVNYHAAEAPNRLKLAHILWNTFEDQGVTFQDAMDAARLVTGPSGRSGFSRKVINRLLRSSGTMQECVARMLADQTEYAFPPLFVKS